MRNAWAKAIGNPAVFLTNISELSGQFKVLAKVEQFELKEIREFLKSRNYELTNQPEVLRAVVAAFSVLLTEKFAQSLRLRGVFNKKIVVESAGFKGELLELFYRCTFEGLDLDTAGEERE
jgi:hypothetical protein